MARGEPRRCHRRSGRRPAHARLTSTASPGPKPPVAPDDLLPAARGRTPSPVPRTRSSVAARTSLLGARRPSRPACLSHPRHAVHPNPGASCACSRPRRRQSPSLPSPSAPAAPTSPTSTSKIQSPRQNRRRSRSRRPESRSRATRVRPSSLAETGQPRNPPSFTEVSAQPAQSASLLAAGSEATQTRSRRNQAPTSTAERGTTGADPPPRPTSSSARGLPRPRADILASLHLLTPPGQGGQFSLSLGGQGAP